MDKLFLISPIINTTLLLHVIYLVCWEIITVIIPIHMNSCIGCISSKTWSCESAKWHTSLVHRERCINCKGSDEWSLCTSKWTENNKESSLLTRAFHHMVADPIPNRYMWHGCPEWWMALKDRLPIIFFFIMWWDIRYLQPRPNNFIMWAAKKQTRVIQ